VDSIFERHLKTDSDAPKNIITTKNNGASSAW